jgi:hypothetical protein
MQLMDFRMTDPFANTRVEIAGVFDRIDSYLRMKKVCIILVDGQIQNGKSTFARWLVSKYDSSPEIIFTAEKLLEYLNNNIDNPKIQNKWILFDELELQAGSTEFRTDRNFVIRAVISSFGYLHNHLIMTCPSMKGIDAQVREMINWRITIRTYEYKKQLIRKAYVKKPYWDKNEKMKWLTFEELKIPIVERSLDYETNKINNFKSSLIAHQERLNKKIKNPMQVDPFSTGW